MPRTIRMVTGRDRQRRLTKPLLMPTLMVGRDRSTHRALALGGAGDVALDRHPPPAPYVVAFGALNAYL
jgi:hypothetical protein